MQPDLFAEVSTETELGEGASILPGFAEPWALDLVDAIASTEAVSPFRKMATRGGQMSVAMTNAGRVGWTSDAAGYRYAAVDPETGGAWPEMPAVFRTLAQRAAAHAGFEGFDADACLINRYAPGARLSAHRDGDERDVGQPIVSVSLGLPATFLWGGTRRSDRLVRVPLVHGDVAIWGGPSRMAFHGIASLKPGWHPLTGSFRYNLTFRRAL